MSPTFEERRSDRLRRYEERRIAEERRDALLYALALFAPIVAAWAMCWAISYALNVLG